MKFFAVFNILFTFRMFEQLLVALKNRVCPEFTVFFILQNFEQLVLALKNRICPEIFHCIEIFLSFRIFEQLDLALKTEFALNFSSRGGGRPPALYATGDSTGPTNGTRSE